MTRIAIISTTINAMPNMMAWAGQMNFNDVMIIVGDLKTPHDAITELVAETRERTGRVIRYVHPDEQRELPWDTVNVIPWNSIQRRNVAILAALTYNPEIILTIDDDNFPCTEYLSSGKTWLDEAYDVVTTPVTEFTWTETGWYNPGESCSPIVVHRGFPLRQRGRRHTQYRGINSRGPLDVGVFAALWKGDPDIDAIERIAKNPTVTSVLWPNDTIAAATTAPFNSQSTAYRSVIAPLMMCLPGVGRMDDIWASYVAQCVMTKLELYVQYGHPIVTQKRNEHDLLQDLQAEMIGYTHTETLCAALDRVELSDSTNVVELLAPVVDALRELPFIPEITLRAYDAWISDLSIIEDAQPGIFTRSKETTDD